MFVTSELMRVREVVVIGAGHLSPARIIKLAGVKEGEHFFSVDYEEVRKRILKEPWVEDVEVRAKFPSALEIRIEEQIPVASYPMRGKWYLVNTKGAIFVAGKERALPVIKGSTPVENLQTAVRFIEFLKKKNLKPKSVLVKGSSVEFEVSYPYHIRVVFPADESSWEECVRRFLAVREKLETFSVQVILIDLRGKNTGFLKIKGGENDG